MPHQKSPIDPEPESRTKRELADLERLRQATSPVKEYQARQRREKRERERSEAALERHRERQRQAEGIAAREGISITEALKVAGATIPEYRVKQARQQRLKGSIEVGTRTSNPQRIIETKEIRQLKQASPALYQKLVEYGVRAAQVEIGTQREVARQSKKQFMTANIELKSGDWINRAELARIKTESPEFYRIVTTKGIDAANKYSQEQFKKGQQATLKRTVSESKLLAYKVGKDSYDLAKFIKKNPGQEQVLRDNGFREADIKAAKEQASLSIPQTYWRAATPWDESKGEKASAGGAATMAAEWVVPGVYEIKHWKELSPGERALHIGIDALIFIPFVGAAAKGAKVVGTAGKLARLAAAGKAVTREASRIAVAPVTMIIHPLSTAKMTLKEVRNLAEILAHPKRLPEAILTTSEGTVRFKVSQATSKAEAMAIRDRLMQLAAKGEHPIIQVKGQTIELTRSPLMRELKGGLSHATPSGEAFEKSLKVVAKEGVPLSERGLFVSHEPVPRFTTASAFGKTGERPAIIITSKETAANAVTSGKIYNSPLGPVAEMESKFPVGSKLKPPSQRLFTRVGPTSQRVEIWLEKPLTNKQILKLKAEGLVEVVKGVFREPIRIKGTGQITGLTRKEVGRLSVILKRTGSIDQARNLLRVGQLARTGRMIPIALSRVVGRVSSRARQEALERVNRVSGIARPERAITRRDPVREAISVRAARITDRADRIERLERADRIKRADRVERVDRAERADRVERVDRAKRVERVDRPDKPLRPPDRPDKPSRPPDRPDKPSRPPKKPEKPPVPLPGDSDEVKRKYIRESARGKVTWNMGKLHGKDVWHVRFDTGQHIVVLGKVPKGATILADGPGSASKTTQRIGHRGFSPFVQQHGAVTATLTSANIPKGASISFRSRPTKSVSKKVGRQYFTKVGDNTLISRRPL